MSLGLWENDSCIGKGSPDQQPGRKGLFFFLSFFGFIFIRLPSTDDCNTGGG